MLALRVEVDVARFRQRFPHLLPLDRQTVRLLLCCVGLVDDECNLLRLVRHLIMQHIVVGDLDGRRHLFAVTQRLLQPDDLEAVVNTLAADLDLLLLFN